MAGAENEVVTGNLEAVLPSEFRLLLGCHLSKHQPWPSLHHLDSVPGFACFFLPRLSLFLGPGSPASKAWRDQDQGVYLVWAMELSAIYEQIWKTQEWPKDWKRSVFIPIPKKGNAQKCSNYHAIAFISHASKVMLKIL